MRQLPLANSHPASATSEERNRVCSFLRTVARADRSLLAPRSARLGNPFFGYLRRASGSNVTHKDFAAVDRYGAIVGERSQLSVNHLFEFIGQRHVASLLDFDDGLTTSMNQPRLTIDCDVNFRTRLRLWCGPRVLGSVLLR